MIHLLLSSMLLGDVTYLTMFTEELMLMYQEGQWESHTLP